MKSISKKAGQWLLPAVLILFILEVVTLPLVLGITYSGRSESPDHILTYTEGALTWDSAAGVGENGAAELDLFDAEYDGVAAENGENVIAPGTEGFHIIRLKNEVSGPVNYTAVLYRIRSSDRLPVETGMSGNGFSDTENYVLPDGVSGGQVIRAVEGTLGSGEVQDFDISWLWEYYEGEEQDKIDTWFGDRAAHEEADRVTAGFYIIVEDGNSYVTPDVPKTGDESRTGMYLALMGISAVVLILLFLEHRREKK